MASGAICDVVPRYDWSVRIGDGRFGLAEWPRGKSTIYVYRPLATVPLDPPGVVSIDAICLTLLGILLFRRMRANSAVGETPHDQAPA